VIPRKEGRKLFIIKKLTKAAVGIAIAFMMRMARSGVRQSLNQDKKLKPIWSCTKIESTSA
jgi:hypothetical protein